MRRPDQWEVSRLDITDLSDEERQEIYAMLGPMRQGRKVRWRLWRSSPNSLMTRFTVYPETEAEALWLKFGNDPRLVDCLRNHHGSASKKFVEAYTHWIDAPFATIEPVIRWARANLHRHHFAWGGQADRWLLWLKTAEARAAFDIAFPDQFKPAPIPPETEDVDRLRYVRSIQRHGQQSERPAAQQETVLPA